MMWQAGR